MQPVPEDADTKTMLGRFLEISINADSPAEGLELFRSLGFRELAASDVLRAPYAAVWDGRIAIGLHARDCDGPALTFVRPELESYLHAFRHAGIELAFARLAEDQFHQIGIGDPNGQLLVLNEARTYSPAVWRPESVPACGELLEYSLATAAFDASIAFWRRLGLDVLAGGEQPHRWTRLGGHGLVLGLHETARFEAGLTFRTGNFDARCEYLQALGRRLRNEAPVAVDAGRSATLEIPYPLAIYLVEEPPE